MTDSYLHFDVLSHQASKRSDEVCGDVALSWRTDEATTILLCDGVGSGAPAHIAATLCAARLKGLMDGGFSFRQSFQSVIATLETWKDPKLPYCAVSAARIRNDGQAAILTYEAPQPVLLGQGIAAVLPQKPVVMENTIVHEHSCYLVAGEGIFLFSDGITQAGLGSRMPNGWTSGHVAEYISRLTAQPVDAVDYCRMISEKADQINHGHAPDDASVVFIQCRRGNSVSVLTGPPGDPARDAGVIQRFLQTPGSKVVCGATTAAIVAREGRKKLDMDELPDSLIAPPRYRLEDIDLATEGALTLNQLCNLLDLDNAAFEEVNSVTELYDLLMQADRVEFLVGTRKNPGAGGISFCQKGILTREKVVPLIADKLRAKGKLVVLSSI